MSWLDGPLCAFDLETTSANPEIARIVTAVVINITPGVPIGVTEYLANSGVSIPAEASAIHGITTDHAMKHGRPVAEVIQDIRLKLYSAWHDGAPVIGHNISYDLTVMAREAIRIRYEFDVMGYVLDSLVLDRATDRRKGKRTLTACCEYYKINLDNAHNATADALASARLVYKIAKRYPHIAAQTLAELQEYQRDKHKAWAESLGSWLTKQGKIDDVCREWPIRMDMVKP